MKTIPYHGDYTPVTLVVESPEEFGDLRVALVMARDSKYNNASLRERCVQFIGLLDTQLAKDRG